MPCPSPIAAIVLEILREGLFRARAAGWSADPSRSALEADHLHNLPHLLEDFSTVMLKYYLEAEVPGYQAQCSRLGIGTEPFTPLWQQLRDCFKSLAEPALTQ